MTIHLAAACAQLNISLQQLQQRMYALAPELSDDRTRRDIGAMVRMFGEDIQDSLSGPMAAHRTYLAVWGDGMATDAWWKSPLGQAVAHWIGYHQEVVPYVAASKILGVSRQRVHQLIFKEGKLTPVEGKHGVMASSLAAHIQSLG